MGNVIFSPPPRDKFAASSRNRFSEIQFLAKPFRATKNWRIVSASQDFHPEVYRVAGRLTGALGRPR